MSAVAIVKIREFEKVTFSNFVLIHLLLILIVPVSITNNIVHPCCYAFRLLFS